jgi:hypothetical protein
MNWIKRLFILHLTLVALLLVAADDSFLKTKMAAEFHEIEGCPINSICSLELGKQRLHWDKFIHELQLKGYSSSDKNKVKLLDDYRKKFGLPVGHYVLGSLLKKVAEHRPILWDSHCDYQKVDKDGSSLYLGESFVQQTTNNTIDFVQQGKYQSLSLQDWMMFTPALLIQKNFSSSKVFRIPNGDFPVMLSHGDMTFLRDEEGLYYYLKITDTGQWSVVPKPSVKNEFRLMECPSEKKIKTIFHEDLMQTIPKNILCYEEITNPALKNWILVLFKFCPV